jgi:HlyD family secretion protein
VDRAIEKTTLQRRRPLVIGLGVLTVSMLLIAVLRQVYSGETLRVAADQVTFATVSSDLFNDDMLLRMAVVPRDIVVIDATEGGRVENVFVSAGDPVKQGAQLVSLSNTQLELQVLEQEGRLIESLTQVQNYQTSLEQNRLNNEIALAEIEYNITRLTRATERREELVRQGIVSRESFDQLQDELDTLKKKHAVQVDSNQAQEALRRVQVPQLKTQIESLHRDMKITRGKLDSLVVRSPQDGRVTSIDLTVGQTLREGDRLAQLTLETGFKLSQKVDEFYISRIQQGLAGTVEVDGDDWPVVVSRVYPEVKEGTFVIELQFSGAVPESLRPGQTIHGRLVLGTAKRALQLPVGPFLNQSGGNWVFVQSGDAHTAVRKSIKVGRRNSDRVEILAGLAAGDRVIVSDYTALDRVDRLDLE